MKIAIVGTGYVGLVSGACFSDVGIDVTCVDVDNRKIENLRKGVIPIYEQGLEDLVKRNTAGGTLHFTSDLSTVVGDVEIIFIAVGTPPDEDGSADLRYVLDVAHSIGRLINGYVLVVTKSTVPVGTSQRVRGAIDAELKKRGVEVAFDVASNPEFLKEGAAIKDFMGPDRVVVGVDTPAAETLMRRLYRPFMLNKDRIIFTDVASAEMIKYAANSMLATRISFMNEIAALCEKVGANVEMVRRGIGSDQRIGMKFLYPGCGYGGSCFPKDVKALIHTAEQNGCRMRVLEAVEEVNNRQKHVLFAKYSRLAGDNIAHSSVAVWGLAFKPETDDMREATSKVLIESLVAAGVEVRVYDPVAMNECRRIFGDRVMYSSDKYEALQQADALFIVTEWKEFRLPDFDKMKKLMKSPRIIDGRNIYDRKEILAEGFEYYPIG